MQMMNASKAPLPDEGMSVVPGLNEPHRRWNTTDTQLARMDFELLVLASKSYAAVLKLINHEEKLTTDEIISLGELNFRCWIQGYEPLVLFTAKRPIKWYRSMDSILNDELIAKISKMLE
ncbi:hypothetical protein C627_09525 [Corynebacterium glutamicum ZL-6]|nr:hypothetical protein C628_09620 [[Brevibacterium] flavum ZL-1]ANR65864.1 hypothetical protein C627_09525 [Corynebacterium glutamicum ZL-6]PST75544.1 hypothetical protein I919_09650 [Corynebacterium glutamicum ZL-2]